MGGRHRCHVSLVAHADDVWLDILTHVMETAAGEEAAVSTEFPAADAAAQGRQIMGLVFAASGVRGELPAETVCPVVAIGRHSKSARHGRRREVKGNEDQNGGKCICNKLFFLTLHTLNCEPILRIGKYL